MKRLLPLLLAAAFACTSSTSSPAAPPSQVTQTATAPPTASRPPLAAAPLAGPVHVVIVGTTDVHGWFAGHDEVAADKTTQVHFGGLPTFKAYVDALRSTNDGRVIVVDSGDLFQGTLESNLFEGEPVIDGYNAIGYTAAAVGNHEFDYGPVGPDSVVRKPGDDPLGALKQNAARAKFPFLSANMTEKATGKVPSWAKAYTIVNAGGAKVGIIGLSTPDTPNVTVEQNVHALDFGDPLPATVAAARELRAQGADAVIVIAHMGGRCKILDQDPHDASSCEVNQEAMRFLGALPKGTIDGYFAGHTHSQIRHFINGVPTMQAAPFSREFSTLDLWIDPGTHHVVADKTEIRPITQICAQVWTGTATCDPRDGKNGRTLGPRTFEGRTITPNVQLAAMFKPYLDKVEAKRKEPTGIRTTARFGRNYSGESALGDLLTDALRAGLHADVAFINSGSIRTDLRAGDLIYSDIFEVSPFDNMPATVDLTGAQIEEALRISSSGERGFLQTSGLKYGVDAAKDAEKPAAARNRLTAVTLADGRPLEREKLYKVALPDFLANGGDGLQAVMGALTPGHKQIRNDLGTIREVFIAALRTFPQPLSPKTEGRITVVNAKGESSRD
jgi:5'-nucleotidase